MLCSGGEGFSDKPSTAPSARNLRRLVEKDPGVEHLDGLGMREPDCLSPRGSEWG